MLIARLDNVDTQERRGTCIQMGQSANRCGGVPAPIQRGLEAVIHRLLPAAVGAAAAVPPPPLDQPIRRVLRHITKRHVHNTTPDASYPENATTATNYLFIKV